VEQQELVAVGSEMAASLRLPMDLDETLERITRNAVHTIPGAGVALLLATTRG
jgi:hypothetical protein